MQKNAPSSRRKPAPGKKNPRRAAPDPLLAAALRDSGEGVFIAGLKFGRNGLHPVFANHSFCAMTGYEAEELARRGHAILHPDAADTVLQRRELKKLRPGVIFSGEGYIRGKSGATLCAAWVFSPLCDARGRCTHLVATYRDVTVRRSLQEALVHAQRLDAVGRLAGGMAHDFNNLLSIINGYCEILNARLSQQDASRREIHEIHQANQKAVALVRQLLAFSRRQRLNPQVMNLNDLVRDHAAILERLLGDAGLLRVELVADLPEVRADPAQLQQVLLNLTLNARDALRENGCVILGTAVREIKPGHNRRVTDARPGRYAVLSVTDNGAGMDAATQARLFEPFFTTKEAGCGTGLGLSMAYGIVRQSGGFIDVRSAPGAGSTFEIFLPAAGRGRGGKTTRPAS